jgi:hypothetical protein
MPLEKVEFKTPKKVLKKRCTTLIVALNKASQMLIAGAKSRAAKKASRKVHEATVAASDQRTSITLNVEIESHDTGLKMFLAQTHGCLISEWHSFLNRVFGELADYCLKNGKSDLVTNKLEISLKGADFSTKVKLRESIRDVLFEKFCSKNHPDRLNRLRKTLKINKDNLQTAEPVKLKKIEDLTKLIRKHVAIRNCLEHADSKVRNRDITSAGYSKKIPMFKADGTICEYKEGDIISVSNKDVRELNDTIIDYMNYFEVKL